jgi:glycosyltransferase involved in cell wall biosynthesis
MSITRRADRADHHDRTPNRPLRIALDASRTTVPRVTGTEHYAIRLLQSLIALNETDAYRHHLTLYFRDPPPPDLFPASAFVTHRVLPQRRLWTHLRFARALWQDRPDVTFVPAHTLPLIFPGRAVVTVHDLGFKIFPKAHPTRQRFYLDLTTRFSANRAAIVLADSIATAEDLTGFYGTESDKIRVVYPGVEITPPDVNQIETVRRKFNLPERYFLFVGTLQPRKNIDLMVRAFDWFRRKSKQDIGFVLAGGTGWLYDPAWTAGVDNLYLPGFIDEADKPALYAGAVALVFATLYEGFGFPVIEAMRCGTPVIGSSTSSLPELVGDAGLLVDPENIETIAAAMERISSDAELRQTLCEQGYAQAQKFNWTHAAQITLDALIEAAQR